MRKLAYFLLLLIFASCGSSGESSFELTPPAEVNPEGIKRAKYFGHRMMNDCVNKKFALLTSDDATKEMVQGLTIATQKDACDHIKGEYGEYHGLEYVECLRPKDGRLYRVYRFKTSFADKRARAETRVVLDGQEKLAGIWTGAWRDVTNL